MTKAFTHADIDITLPPLKDMLVNGKRFYRRPDDSWIPSVTTVTGWRDREKWKEWRKQNWDKSQKILRRGTNVHSAIERYIEGKDALREDEALDVKDMFLNIKGAIDEHVDNIYGLELPLYGDRVPLAGRVDCIAEFDGELSIIDFKTTERMKKPEWCEDYFLQCTAYAMLWQERTNIPIKKIVIMMVSGEGECTCFVRNPIDYVPELKERIDEFYSEFSADETIEEIAEGHAT